MSEIQLANTEQLPTFKGEAYEDHVSTWLEVDRSVQGHYWMLGAIAASLVKKHGDDVMGKFGSDVGRSARTIRFYASTYRAWETGTRVPILTFRHHAIAARAEDPQKAIEAAADKELSTRELETFVKTGELPDGKQNEEVIDVDREDPDAIREIVRAGTMEYVVEFNDGSRHAISRQALLERGYKPCKCCGYGVVRRHDQGQE
jgi:hypothetical protein